MSWITESNRTKHVLYGAIVAYFGTILFSLGAAFGMEFKDCQYGGMFDLLDIAATVIGGLIGQSLQVINIIIFIAWIENTSNIFLILLFVFYSALLVAVSVYCLNKLKEIR